MNIPQTVKIGGLIYDVSLSNNLLRDSDAMGSSCGNSQSIVLDSTISKQMQESTFIHEIVHQLSYVHHLDLDEAATCRLESAIYAFIIDNPDVFEKGGQSDGKEKGD